MRGKGKSFQKGTSVRKVSKFSRGRNPPRTFSCSMTILLDDSTHKQEQKNLLESYGECLIVARSTSFSFSIFSYKNLKIQPNTRENLSTSPLSSHSHHTELDHSNFNPSRSSFSSCLISSDVRIRGIAPVPPTPIDSKD